MLTSEIEILKLKNIEKDDLIRTLKEKIVVLQNWAQENFASICNNMNENAKLHLKNEANLEQKISDINDKIDNLKETKESPQNVVKLAVNGNHNCRGCNSTFGRKAKLNSHIQTCHPRKIDCAICDQCFDQNWKLEVHIREHVIEERFPCNMCDKRFVLSWRLKKHMKGHLEKKC